MLAELSDRKQKPMASSTNAHLTTTAGRTGSASSFSDSPLYKARITLGLIVGDPEIEFSDFRGLNSSRLWLGYIYN